MSVEIKISPDRTDEFVERLVTDHEFRRALEESPAETLAEYDIAVTPDLLAEPVSLPPPEEVARARAAIDPGEFAPETSRFAANPLVSWFRKFRRLVFRR